MSTPCILFIINRHVYNKTICVRIGGKIRRGTGKSKRRLNIMKTSASLISGIAALALFSCAPAQAQDVYNATTNVLTINLIPYGHNVYSNVQILGGTLVSVGGGDPARSYATYDAAQNLLTLSIVQVGGGTFTNIQIRPGQLLYVGGATPQADGPVLAVIDPLPEVTVGQSTYTTNVVSSVWPERCTFSLDSFAGGAPPPGMTLDLNGNLKGVPSRTGRTDVNGNQLEKSYTFGVCATDTFTRKTTRTCPRTTITVKPPKPSTMWVGTWQGSWTGGSGCQWNDGGAFSMVLTQDGSSFSGTTHGEGIEIRYYDTCELDHVEGQDGTASGTVSGSTINIQFNFSSPAYGTLDFTGTATLSGKTMNCTFTTSGGGGSFTATLQ
jgi:hypothetical protein